jgi:hypothetical protein
MSWFSNKHQLLSAVAYQKIQSTQAIDFLAEKGSLNTGAAINGL